MDTGYILIGGAVALWLVSKYNTASHLQFTPTDASWDGGSLQVQLDVFNPSTDELTLNGLSGTLYVNGTSLGIVSLPPGQTPKLIASQAHTPVLLAYTPNIFGAISAALNQIRNGGGINLSFSGSAVANGITAPLTFQLQAVA